MPENYNIMQLNIIQPGSDSECYLANVINIYKNKAA
jgi:hypothetical protein